MSKRKGSGSQTKKLPPPPPPPGSRGPKAAKVGPPPAPGRSASADRPESTDGTGTGLDTETKAMLKRARENNSPVQFLQENPKRPDSQVGVCLASAFILCCIPLDLDVT